MDGVSQRLLATIGVVSALRRHRRFGDDAQVDAGAPVQHPPDDAGEEKHGRLTHQDDRRPLVVSDLSQAVGVRLRGFLVERHVVGLRHPAVEVGVSLVVGGAVLGTPAVDRLAPVGARRDEEREEEQQRWRVPSAQSVAEVVVSLQLQCPDVEQRLQQRLHCQPESAPRTCAAKQDINLYNYS